MVKYEGNDRGHMEHNLNIEMLVWKVMKFIGLYVVIYQINTTINGYYLGVDGIWINNS